MSRLIILTTIIFLIKFSAFSQTIPLEGYVFESGNRGFLNVVKVDLKETGTDLILQSVFSDINGYFELQIDPSKDHTLSLSREMFEPIEVLLAAKDNAGKEKQFSKIEMRRAPGYQFEITLAPKREEESIPVDAIKGALIEVYNNTTREEVMVLKDHPHPDFAVNLIKGNHYTILVRKDGFLAKRMEAFVDVEGCILCFEGVGSVTPGVAENLTEGNQMGVLLANVELESIFTGKKMEIRNIYYDFGKATLRSSAKKELDNLVILIKDNPEVLLELGSHTDSRGTKQDNNTLSLDRANAAVDYLVEVGNVSRSQITARGYGESSIKNGCTDGVQCSEEKHQENRRTELKIVGLVPNPPAKKSLKKMKLEENMDDIIKELQNQEQIKVTGDQTLEDVIGEKAPQVEKDLSEPVAEDVGSGVQLASEAMEEEMKEQSQVVETVIEEVVEEASESVELVEEEVTEIVETPKEGMAEVAETVNEEITKVEQEKPQMEVDVEEVKEEMEVMEEKEVEVGLPSGGRAEATNDNPYAFLNGPKIVIMESEKFIKPDHEIFSKHEQVYQYVKQGTIYYMVGNFNDKTKAEEYLKTMKMVYPDAYMLVFDSGNIVK